ncbi:MAG TPA: 5-oxoprolinase subunit PxpA [Thermoanaerobaculia bacterium]|nr:5-oxoprolinase subunit PxpA [Thermoanaerobaculia bacterium]
MIDLSADLGEGSPGEDEIWPLIDSANVACGGHYGDEQSMREAVRLAREHGVKLGAHPSYPDRENFGRRSIDIPPDALRDSLIAQIESLRALAPLHHVKPHGALYNDAHRNRALADVIVAAMRAVDPALALVAPDHSEMAAAARAAGIRVIREAFADRRYEPDGSLVSRKEPGSTLTIEEAAEQAALLAREGVVISSDGSRVRIDFDTLCIHADMERAVERLRAIRLQLAS